ncbi:hypothetical protein YB2330_001879 [Saitoella coloradoensis]
MPIHRGVVVSAGLMAKTVKVRVATRVMHPIVRKVITKHTSFLVHDEEQTGQIGDIVEIAEGEQRSTKKKFTITKKIHEAKLPALLAQAAADLAQQTKQAKQAEQAEQAGQANPTKPARKAKHAKHAK